MIKFLQNKANKTNLIATSLLLTSLFVSTFSFSQKKIKAETTCSHTSVTPETELRVTTNLSCLELKSLTNCQVEINTDDGYTHVSSVVTNSKTGAKYTGTCSKNKGKNTISFGSLPTLGVNEKYILESTFKCNLYNSDDNDDDDKDDDDENDDDDDDDDKEVISPNCARSIKTVVSAKCDNVEEKYTNTSSCTFVTRPTITKGTVISPTFCNGNDGSIKLTGLLKNTTYKLNYTKNNVSITSSLTSDNAGVLTVSNLTSGSYNDFYVTLGTLISNKITTAIILSNPTLKTITKGTPSSPASCNSSDGKLVFNNFNNSTTYSFSYTRNGISSSTIVTSSSTGVITISNLGAGEYSNFYALLNGCKTNTLNDKITLTVPSLKAITKGTFTSPTTCSSKDGSIRINGLNNSTLYTISYTKNGVTNIVNITSSNSGVGTIPGLVAAEYSNFFATLNGCNSNTITDKITLINPKSPVVTKGTITSPTTCSSNNGSIQLNGLTKNTTFGITFSKNGVTTSASSTSNNNGILTLSNLSAADYSNIYVNLNGCLSNMLSEKITLTNPVVPSITLGKVTNLSTCTVKDGSIEINGLTPSKIVILNYKKDDVNTRVDVTASNTGVIKISNLDVATYSDFNITTNGCTTNTLVDKVIMSNPITLTIAKDNVANTSNCAIKDGIIQLNGLANNTTYSCKYTKNGVNNSIISTSNELGILSIPNLEAGDYTNIYVAINGCVSNTLSERINVSTPVEPTFTVGTFTSPSLCNAANGSIELISSMENMEHIINYTSNGTNSTLTQTSLGNKLTIANLKEGNYTNFSITVNGCLSNVKNSIITLTDPIANTIAIHANSHPTTCTTNDGNIQLIGLENSTSYNVSFTKNNANENATLNSNESGIISVANLTAGTYSNFSVENKGCNSNIITSLITLSEPTSPTFSRGNFSHPTGCGLSDGSIEFYDLQANTEYTLNYTNNENQVVSKISTSSTGTYALNNLNAGDYSNIFMIYKNCQSSISSEKITLINPLVPVIYLGKLSTPLNCLNCKSTLEIKGLDNNYTYSIYYKRNNESETREISSDNSGNAFLTNLSEGIYTEFYIKKYECNSNVVLDQITVQEVKTESNTSNSCKNILVNIEDDGIKNVSCSSLNDGSVTFSILNGSSNNLYRIRKKNFNGSFTVVTFPAYSPTGNLENEIKTMIFNGLGIGEYDITAYCNENPNMFNTKYFTIGKDVCTGPISYECTNLNLTLNKSDINPASCKSDNDGSILFTVSGGFPNNLYRIRKKNNDGSYTTITSPAFKPVENSTNEIKEIKVNNLALGDYDLYIYCANDVKSFKSLTFSITKAKCTLVTNELIAYFPFKGSAIDESGNNHSSIINCVDQTMDNYNDPKGAYHLNGLYNNITIKDVIDIDTAKGYTVSLWYKLNEYPAEDGSTLLSIPNNSSNTLRAEFAFDKDGAIRYNYGNGTNSQLLRSNEIALKNKWNHVVLTNDKTTNTIYHNGKLLNSSSSYAFSNNLVDIVLGYIGNSKTADASVDELRVYSRAISETEVQTIYLNEAVENCSAIRLNIDAVSHPKTLTFTVINGSANNKYRLRKKNEAGVFVSMYSPTFLSLNNQIGETKSMTITDLVDGVYDIYAYCGSDGTKYQGYQFVISNGSKMIQTVTTPESTIQYVEEKQLTEESAGLNESEMVDESKFTIYPNPTDNFVYISAEEGEIIKFVRVFNTNGQLVFEGVRAEDNLEKCINVSSWSSGNYILEIFLENKPSVRKNFILK
jgi:hypothetical protein